MGFDFNKLSYFEIRGSDYEKSKQFYLSLFDWKIERSWGDQPYGIIHLGDGQEGGLEQAAQGRSPRVIFYFAVDDIDATLSAVEKAGGKILNPKTLITEEYGYYATFSDPDGNVIGLSSKS